MSTMDFEYRYADPESAGYASSYLQDEAAYTINVSQENVITIRVRGAFLNALEAVSSGGSPPKSLSSVHSWIRSTVAAQNIQSIGTAASTAGIRRRGSDASPQRRPILGSPSHIQQPVSQSPQALLDSLQKVLARQRICKGGEITKRFLREQGLSLDKEQASEIIKLISEQMVRENAFDCRLFDIGAGILQHCNAGDRDISTEGWDSCSKIIFKILMGYSQVVDLGRNQSSEYFELCETVYNQIFSIDPDREVALACANGLGDLYTANRQRVFSLNNLAPSFHLFYGKAQRDAETDPIGAALRAMQKLIDLDHIANTSLPKGLANMKKPFLRVGQNGMVQFVPYDPSTHEQRPEFAVTLNLLSQLDSTIPQEKLAIACSSGIDREKFLQGQTPYVEVGKKPDSIRLHMPAQYVQKYNHLFHEKLVEDGQDKEIEFPAYRFEFMLRKWGMISGPDDATWWSCSFRDAAASDEKMLMFPEKQELAPPELLPIVLFARAHGDRGYGILSANETSYRVIVGESSEETTIIISPALDPESSPLFSEDEIINLNRMIEESSIRLKLHPDGNFDLQCGSKFSQEEAQQIIAKALSVGTANFGTQPPELIDPGFSPDDMITLRAVMRTGRFLPLLQGPANTPRTMRCEDHYKYGVWTHLSERGNTIVDIQELASILHGKFDRHMAIEINEEGHLLSIYVNHQRVSSLNQEQKDIVRLCSKTALESSSEYSLDESGVYVITVMRGPKQSPWNHLQQLSLALEAYKEEYLTEPPEIRVTFIDNELEPMSGSDEGGLSRAYFDDLFSGIAQKAQLQFFRPNDSETADFLPVEGHEELYRAIGLLFIVCLASEKGEGPWDRTLTTGEHFSPELFRALLSFSHDDAHAPELGPQIKNQLEELIIEIAVQAHRNLFLEAIPTMKNTAAMMDFLNSFTNYKEQSLSDVTHLLHEISTLESIPNQVKSEPEQRALHVLKEKQASLNKLYTILLLTAEEGSLTDQNGDELDPTDFFQEALTAAKKPATDRTPEDLSLLHRLAQQAQECVSNPAFISEKITSAGVDLSALKQIAMGLQDAIKTRFTDPSDQAYDLALNDVRHTPYDVVSKKIQGETNREAVATSLYSDPSAPEYVKERLRWTQEWIREETTTDEEIRQFLKWITGSTGVSSQGIVFAASSRERSYPIVHTCASMIEISQRPYMDEEIPTYNSKDGFIDLIKRLSKELSFSLV